MKILPKKEEIKFKDKKFYAVGRDTDSSKLCCLYDDIADTKRALDSRFNVLVELTITRVFTRENEMKEIELDL